MNHACSGATQRLAKHLLALSSALLFGLASAAPPPPPLPAAPPARPLVLSAPPAVNGAAPTALSAAELATLKHFLVIDFANLFAYDAPVLPAFYDAALLRADNTPADNRISNAGATLGRVLFNDKRLSTNNAVSCASCHQQALGFTDAARFSAGVAAGAVTTAHSMRLGNVAFYRPGAMFWDKRAASLELQATQPLQNGTEMGWDAAHGGINALIARMQNLPYYPLLFKWVYGTPAITEARMQKALAQFERAMVAADSRWDAGFARVYNPQLPDRGLSLDVPGLSAQENAGRRLFLNPPQQGGLGCAGCHEAPTFALSGNSLSNGLDAGNTVVFKSPSLKSVALGKAFMHDGRFTTLEQVVDHYDHGVKNGPALDNRLKGPNGQPRVLNLRPTDKAALVAFLKTLTDSSFLGSARFTDPFR